MSDLKGKTFGEVVVRKVLGKVLDAFILVGRDAQKGFKKVDTIVNEFTAVSQLDL